MADANCFAISSNCSAVASTVGVAKAGGAGGTDVGGAGATIGSQSPFLFLRVPFRQRFVIFFRDFFPSFIRSSSSTGEALATEATTGEALATEATTGEALATGEAITGSALTKGTIGSQSPFLFLRVPFGQRFVIFFLLFFSIGLSDMFIYYEYNLYSCRTLLIFEINLFFSKLYGLIEFKQSSNDFQSNLLTSFF